MPAFDIHEWIHDTMKLNEAEVAMVQLDGAKSRSSSNYVISTKSRRSLRPLEAAVWYEIREWGKFDGTHRGSWIGHKQGAFGKSFLRKGLIVR
jgi:hypothetical protein